MKNVLTVLIFAGLLTLAAGCAPNVSDESAPPVQSTGEPADLDHLTFEIPDAYQHLLLIETDFVEEDPHRIPLLQVYEKASAEAAEKVLGSREGFGFLFGISVLDQTALEKNLQFQIGGTTPFATDGTRYYAKITPTDVRFFREEDYIDTESADWKQWEALQALGDQVCAEFTERNGLTPYSDSAFFSRPFTYDGSHVYIQYYPYYGFDGSKREFDTLVLSQPAKQGDGGIWCVERLYDLYGTLYPIFPSEDLPAAEVYAARQAECDAGQRPELLTPLGAAKDFVEQEGWYGRPCTEDAAYQICDAPDTDYFETNQQLAEVIPALLNDRTVEDGELLELLAAFRPDTWGVLGRTQYGSDWWPPLQSALEAAAVGDGQAERDRSMMAFYLTSYGRYADFVGGQLKRQQASDPKTFQSALEEFYPEQQSALLAAVA